MQPMDTILDMIGIIGLLIIVIPFIALIVYIIKLYYNTLRYLQNINYILDNSREEIVKMLKEKAYKDS